MSHKLDYPPKPPKQSMKPIIKSTTVDNIIVLQMPPSPQQPIIQPPQPTINIPIISSEIISKPPSVIKPIIQLPPTHRFNNRPPPPTRSTPPININQTPIIIPTITPFSNNNDILPPPLPSSDTAPTNNNNILPFVIIGAVVVGFMILKNKDI